MDNAQGRNRERETQAIFYDMAEYSIGKESVKIAKGYPSLPSIYQIHLNSALSDIDGLCFQQNDG